MNIFLNTNSYNLGFSSNAKLKKASVNAVLKFDIINEVSTFLKKQGFSEKQITKIEKFIKKRPVEVQNFYNASISFADKKIDASKFINQVGNSVNTILDKNIGVYAKEAVFLTKMAEVTDMFHPAAVNEKYFKKLIDELFLDLRDR